MDSVMSVLAHAELRKLNSDQRQELIKKIEEEEKFEKEELQKNPNLNMERKLDTLLHELQSIRNELNMIKSNTAKPLVCPTSLSSSYYCNDDSVIENGNEDDLYSSCSWDWNILFWIFFFLVFTSIIISPKKSCPIII